MKRRIITILVILPVVVAAAYVIPILAARLQARPLYGDFDLELKCMGGHEIFLRLDDQAAYEHCPGHRDMAPIGTVLRDAHSATVLSPEESAPLFRVDFDGTQHSLSVLAPLPQLSIIRYAPVTVTQRLQQVSNPWRTWLPTKLPE